MNTAPAQSPPAVRTIQSKVREVREKGARRERTEGEVDDEVVGPEMLGDVARLAREVRERRALSARALAT